MLFKLVFILLAALSVLAQLPTTRKHSICRDGEFRCKDGACIAGASRCNGSIECTDRSDETFALCRNNKCPLITQFRCTYGACMSYTVRCNDKQDCADNSDELVPACRNDFGDFNICQEHIMEDRQLSRAVDCNNHLWKCANGEDLKEPTRCDGRVDCKDGSDETLATCAEAECVPPLFRCAYGGCAHPGARCDNVEDCADGSDESYELCGRTLPVPTTPKPVCRLPAQPRHGHYSLGGKVQGVPGQTFPSFMLTYTCDPPYEIVGPATVFCFSGLDKWAEDIPKCVRFCKLPKHESVEYHCRVSENEERECEELEPDGTIVRPRCRSLMYSPLPPPAKGKLYEYENMHCNGNQWDHILTCALICGKLGPPADGVLPGPQAREAGPYELPWHVAIYRRMRVTQVKQMICSGTIVKQNVVISAAHCFWGRRGLVPPLKYAVAAGKLYRAWDHPNDTNAQTSDVREISVPGRFRGLSTNFQDDIAVVILITDLQYTLYVRPVCIDFDNAFDSQQLKILSVGKIAGWGKTATGNFSETLHVADLPNVPIQTCIADTPDDYKVYITSDKICAGFNNGTGLCQGRGGAGLTFPPRTRNSHRYYLRGVASIASNNGPLCNEATITRFTHVASHKQFLQEYL